MSNVKLPINPMKPEPDSWHKTLFASLFSSPEDYALFLDIDGTLVDLAATPDDIEVPARLPAELHALSRKLNGALALVTGRSLSYTDRLFAPFRFPTAGLHGAERRLPDGSTSESVATPAFEKLKADLVAATTGWDGILVEDKGAAVAAHYRLSPQRRSMLEPLMEYYVERAGPDRGAPPN